LLGIWTREEAAANLRVISGRRPEEDPTEKLSKRGDTWEIPGKKAADQLMTLFVNPAQYFGSGNRLEPDSQPVDQDQARGAILFGPPGTSKTTLAGCVADAIGWDYVEIHASHFVADGLPNVQRTANAIFEKLLQLDRTVILFDEIDELVRAREAGADAFGRFLTTSMLPKLAELWKLRKVIYFVATNHIGLFDPAVTRAQRFDALVRVSPPSFEAKLEELVRLLKLCFDPVTLGEISSSDVAVALKFAVEAANTKPEHPLPDQCILAKLLLLRFDQLQELASIIRKQIKGKNLTVDRKLLEDALVKFSDPSLLKCAPFKEYLDSERYQQHDFSKVRIWKVQGDITAPCKVKLSKSGESYWYVSKAPFGDLSDFPSRHAVVAPGVVECTA